MLIMIGRWYSRQPLTNHKSPFSTERNPEILAPKASTHSAYSLGTGELLPIATIVKGVGGDTESEKLSTVKNKV